MVDREAADEIRAQLLRRIATEDRQALAELYDQLGGALYSIAVRILGDSQEAEEVMQDVFVQIWEKADAFDALLGTPTNWMMRIARNRSIDRLRARQRRCRTLEEFESAVAAAATASLIQGGDLSDEELLGVREAVGALPAEQRQAIEMAFFGGLSHGEISAALNEPLGTVKARIRRGMLKLKDTLQPYA